MKRIRSSSLFIFYVLSTGVFAQWNPNGTSIYYNSGNVGIGTDSPENTHGWEKVLNVHGTNHSKIITTSSLVNTGIWSHNTGFYGAPAGGIVGTFSNHPFSIITNQSAKMTINTDGNIGIGTTNPSAGLYINKTGVYGALAIQNQYGGITHFGFPDGKNYIRGTTIIADAGGNVGIGTTNPQAKLHTYGTANTAIIMSETNTGEKAFMGGNNGTVFMGGYSQNHNLWITVGNSPKITVNTNGNTGIGTTNPEQILHVNGSSEILSTGSGSGFKFRDRAQGSTDNWAWYSHSNIARLWRQGTGDVMSINTSGNVGIGTTTPTEKLDVVGNIKANNGELSSTITNSEIGGRVSILNPAKSSAGQASTWRIYNMSGSYGNSLQFWAYDNISCNQGGLCASRLTLMDNGNVGIGTISPDHKLEVNGNIEIQVEDADNQLRFHDPNDMWFSMGMDKSDGQNFKINYGGTVGATNHFTMRHDGNILIGNPTAQHALDKYKLNVNGVIRANEVVVNTDGADFVFEENYKLPTLAELEKHIKEKKHLPGIAPASTMQNEGMNVSEMQTKLLQKIEELTLYVIEQQKQIELLKEQNTLIQDNFNQLKK